MKNLTLLAVFLIAVSFTSCKSKYPDLDKGLYAEFITNKGTFVAKFYEKATPLTVANFVELAEGSHEMVDSVYKGKPYFNNLTFHRVIKDFMIQGGDPKGDGTGNPGYRFPDEFVDSLKHDRKGLLSMANSGAATNGSQFFITLKETPWLDGKHTVFGEIVVGQQIVDTIGSVETSKPGDKPVEPVIIQEVNIINKGATVPSFAAEMENIEKAKKEKEERLAKVAETTMAELNELKTKSETTESGLQIHWNNKAGGARPTEADQVKLNYVGYFADGRLLDTNVLEVAEKYERVDQRRLAAGQYAPIQSPYNTQATFIAGFEEGMLQMSVGDKVTLFIPSHLAWGEQGAPRGGIPPNTDVIFELELTEIVNNAE
ncbi:peptidylprolyl isomerase [Aureisphaera galaxeae]|uniref:peptidylprolyl isomerase n=1 Tax=Aureisphaera galaxeae TaxID=1538023 RepID=UPI00234FE2CC|nr:peptidylprolyl isomerase [Aureisphaera galaxeae]MDC8003471.1 peptidylprolyl isomerase [Aureisphaera galaxeae]